MTDMFRNRSLSRRSFLTQAALASGALAARGAAVQPPPSTFVAPEALELKRAAQRSGKILGTYTVGHDLLWDPAAAAIIANGFSMIADGNDLKFSNRLRPTPDTFDFATGDQAVGWAEQHHLLFRGHCLVWWNALPKWFNGYVNAGNAKQVMTHHISTVVGHYRGRIYSWDVVNEAIHNDGRPDQLRRKPWLDFIGPEYIDIAFHTAHEADPKARLVLNECFVEHATPAETERRAAYLALATRLRKSGVPITDIGIQGHLRGATPLDVQGMTTFLKQLQDLGLQIQITELDVDDFGVPPEQRMQVASDKFSAFLDLVNPYAKVITFEAVHDIPVVPHNMNLFSSTQSGPGKSYEPNPAFSVAMKRLNQARVSR